MAWPYDIRNAILGVLLAATSGGCKPRSSAPNAPPAILDFRVAPVVSDLSVSDLNSIRDEFQNASSDHAQRVGLEWFVLESPDSWAATAAQRTELHSDTAKYFVAFGVIAEQRGDKIYILLHDREPYVMLAQSRTWKLKDSSVTVDQLGRPAIGIVLDADGAHVMGSLTRTNIGKPLAILLDDEVYSFPNINSEVGKNGIISGEFGERKAAQISQRLKSNNREQ